MNKVDQSPRVVAYRNGRYSSIVLGVLAMLIALVRIWQTAAVDLGSTIIALVGLLVLISGFAIRLVISQSGIEYHQVGYSIRSAWDRNLRIGSSRAGWVYADSLIITQYEVHGLKWLSRISGMRPKGAVPLSLFDSSWRTSELGRAIMQYAPHLLEDMSQFQSTYNGEDAA